MRELVVGVGEGAVSSDRETMLVTYALGSCVAVMVHDPVSCVAGMLHYILPESPASAAGPADQPCRFADTGIEYLLRMARKLGADQRHLLIFAAGGVQVVNDNAVFDIGRRNCLALHKQLWRFGLVPHAEETGGALVRTVRMEVGSGRVWLQSPGGGSRELRPCLEKTALSAEALR
ncbi:MAG: chemotaxis protein CheD [Acidobacteriota bacterium]